MPLHFYRIIIQNENRPRRLKAQSIRRSRLKPIRILLAEDEVMIAEDIQINLEHLGYRVPKIVISGEEAVESAGRLKPDIVMMDILLKGEMDGIRAAQIIRESHDIPVIYLTSYSDKKTLDRAKITEPFGYILKPFQIDTIQSAIELALYKHRMERRLSENEKRFRLFYEEAPVSYQALDASARIIEVNEAWTAMMGLDRKEALGTDFRELIDPAVRDRFEQAFQTFLSNGTIQGLEIDLISRKDARLTVHLDGRTGFGNRGKRRRMHCILHDITERKMAEQALRESEERMRHFSAYLQRVREEERTHIAREIHDELGQALTALKMDLSWLRSKGKPESDLFLRKIDAMTLLIDQTLGRVKKISTELRPGLLDDLGLDAAIEWQAEEFQARTGIRCDVRISPEDRKLDEARSTAIFRILQEALTNIIRHAEATAVSISLSRENGNAVLSVRDNGRGITRSQIENKHAFGLIGIRERAGFLGGEVFISGNRNKGTTVRVCIPAGEESPS
ncbi:MAG TPA: response regulator [bacterium]|nr:response regulator [bacterium]